jgi:hypothetical protein
MASVARAPSSLLLLAEKIFYNDLDDVVQKKWAATVEAI